MTLRLAIAPRATRGAALLAALALPILAQAAAAPPAARALVERPATVDGPSADVLDAGDVALAPDGTGAIAYTKADGGVPHVFVARRLHGAWTAPLRADALPYDATQPRVAASEHGRLLVVWVSQIATVHGRIRRALYSAELAPGGGAFGRPTVVDPDVADGTDGREVDPSLAGTTPGRAIVAYRVVTYDFGPDSPYQPAVRLGPADVMADVRVARYQGTRWSRLGAVNRNAEASSPPAASGNGPRIGLADDNSAVVAWQERDQGAVARIWARRVFGTALGPILPVGPQAVGGAPITGDADAFALDVSPLGMAQVVARIPDPSDGTTRVFANRLPVSLDAHAGTFAGAAPVDGGPLGVAGPPAVAVADGGQDGSSRVAFASSAGLRTAALGSAPALGGPPWAPGPATAAGAAAVALSAAGGTVTAGTATGADGLPAVALRQDHPSGAVQTGVIAGAQAGDVSRLTAASDVAGDAVVGFLQSTATGRQVVAAAVTAAPARFTVTAPAGWVRPRSARLTWDAAPSTAPRITYTVLLDGEPVARGLAARALRPAPDVLGDGTRSVQVVATDASGQSVASDPVDLKVDARAPRPAVAAAPRRRYGRHAITVTVGDGRGSGVDAAHTSVRFGDGARVAKGHRTFHHRYRRAGRYVVRVVTRDRAGNATTVRRRVTVR